jgi:hypothetical protein
LAADLTLERHRRSPSQGWKTNTPNSTMYTNCLTAHVSTWKLPCHFQWHDHKRSYVDRGLVQPDVCREFCPMRVALGTVLHGGTPGGCASCMTAVALPVNHRASSPRMKIRHGVSGWMACTCSFIQLPFTMAALPHWYLLIRITQVCCVFRVLCKGWPQSAAFACVCTFCLLHFCTIGTVWC